MSSTTDRKTRRIGPYTVTLFHQARVLAVDKQVIRLSPKECQVVHTLLKGHAISDNQLAKALFKSKCDPYIREGIDRNVEYVRKKLRKEGIPLEIHRLFSYGYLLGAVEEEVAS